ncbi:hypothetical protein yc1106_02206 [Curvularia clavata]|uniref:Uncharacterized protein n=1 Tax=Curvularia clavata TaxID=95742 RepID=A0A9Q9DPU7_CURCL|nr:hypothetical protein yc1106_02206 [Curvularia clavata]
MLFGQGKSYWDRRGRSKTVSANPKSLAAHNLVGKSSISYLYLRNSPGQAVSIKGCERFTVSYMIIHSPESDSLPLDQTAHNTDGFDIRATFNILIDNATVRNQDNLHSTQFRNNIYALEVAVFQSYTKLHRNAIAECLESEKDINAIAQANHRLYRLLDSYLYHYNVKHCGGSALLWSAQHGQEGTARKSLRENANVQGTDGSKDKKPLFLAAENGQKKLVKLLLENGASVTGHGQCVSMVRQ